MKNNKQSCINNNRKNHKINKHKKLNINNYLNNKKVNNIKSSKNKLLNISKNNKTKKSTKSRKKLNLNQNIQKKINNKIIKTKFNRKSQKPWNKLFKNRNKIVLNNGLLRFKMAVIYWNKSSRRQKNNKNWSLNQNNQLNYLKFNKNKTNSQ
jgi:hypothetical protein